MLAWLVSELNPQSPVLWLLLSLVATMATSVALWRSQPAWSMWLWVGQWLLIPYLGLIFGGLSPRLMGLTYFNWSTSLGLGLGLLFAIVALFVIVRIALSHTVSGVPSTITGEHSRTDTHHRQASSPWRLVTSAVLVGGAEEFHWAFLRGAVWEILLTAPFALDLPSYWAIWIAAAIVLVELSLRRLTGEDWLVYIAVLTTTSILFLFVQNFWLCWILHSVALLILNTGDRTPSPQPARPPNSSR